MILRVGQNVRIEVQVGDGQTELDGAVLQVGKGEVMLSFPRHKVLPSVKAGARVVLNVWDRSGLHQGKTRVNSVTKVPHPGVIIVALPRSYQTRQKRNYFRLETSLAMTFSGPGADAKRAVTEDISAGGLKFKTLHALAVGDKVQVTVDIPRGERAAGSETMSLESHVVRATQTNVDGEVQFTISCEFENVPDSRRDQMVKLLLDLQSKVR